MYAPRFHLTTVLFSFSPISPCPRDAPDGLTFDIAFALIRALKIPNAVSRVRRGITDNERHMMAQAIPSSA
jgi:hypothetical protein